jgi:integrase
VEFNHEKPRDEHLRPDEVPAVRQEIQAEADPWTRGFLLLALLTGARGGELVRIKWRDVSLETGEVVLRDTKNKTDFRLKLSGAAADVLRGIPRCESEYVFPRRRRDREDRTDRTFKNKYMSRPRKAWEDVLRRAGIDRGVTLHDLRRSAGVLLGARGFTAEQIASQLNHKSNVTAKVYVRVAEDLQQRMADTLADAAAKGIGEDPHANQSPASSNSLVPNHSGH